MDALAARGVKLAICTNKPERLTHLLVDALGWSGRFAAIVGADTLPVRKPDPRPLHEAIARAGGGRAAFVGDFDHRRRHGAGGGRAVRRGQLRLFRPAGRAQLGADAVIDGYGELIRRPCPPLCMGQQTHLPPPGAPRRGLLNYAQALAPRSTLRLPRRADLPRAAAPAPTASRLSS